MHRRRNASRTIPGEPPPNSLAELNVLSPAILPDCSPAGTCSEVHGHLEKHHEGVLRNGGVARVCTDLLFQYREGERENERDRKEKRQRREEERQRWNGVGGVCSLLPGDRVHRLLVVDAPKSRIFEKQLTSSTRLAFSSKAIAEGNEERDEKKKIK